MKKIKIVIVLSFLLYAAITSAQPPMAIQLAQHIAQKMKDTLGLTQSQWSLIYDANIRLHNEKMYVRQHNTDIDSIRIKTQSVEGTRDTLYHSILPAPKYVLYLQKKRNLVTAN
jgi:pyruvate formate-lyase activating enzyme-like uncharacterized protein